MYKLPEFYLDTSSVRSGAKKLAGRRLPQTFGTSAFTLIELINGLRGSDADYARRAASIRNLIGAPVIIRWSFPETILASAFSALIVRDDRPNRLSQVVSCVQKSETRSAYAAAISRLGFDDVLEELENYDEVFGRQFIEATVSQKYDIRGAFDHERNNAYSLIPHAVLNGTYQGFCDWWMQHPMNVGFTRLALVENYARSCMKNPTETDKERIYDSYNGTANTFLKAMAYRTMGYERGGSEPARNDAADLAHFAYLREGMTLVTEDKGMRKAAELIGIRVLSLFEVLSGSTT